MQNIFIAKRFDGKPRQGTLQELVPNWWKIFPPVHFDLIEMNQPTSINNKTSTA